MFILLYKRKYNECHLFSLFDPFVPVSYILLIILYVYALFIIVLVLFIYCLFTHFIIRFTYLDLNIQEKTSIDKRQSGTVDEFTCPIRSSNLHRMDSVRCRSIREEIKFRMTGCLEIWVRLTRRMVEWIIHKNTHLLTVMFKSKYNMDTRERRLIIPILSRYKVKRDLPGSSIHK